MNERWVTAERFARNLLQQLQEPHEYTKLPQTRLAVNSSRLLNDSQDIIVGILRPLRDPYFLKVRKRPVLLPAPFVLHICIRGKWISG